MGRVQRCSGVFGELCWGWVTDAASKPSLCFLSAFGTTHKTLLGAGAASWWEGLGGHWVVSNASLGVSDNQKKKKNQVFLVIYSCGYIIIYQNHIILIFVLIKRAHCWLKGFFAASPLPGLRVGQPWRETSERVQRLCERSHTWRQLLICRSCDTDPAQPSTTSASKRVLCLCSGAALTSPSSSFCAQAESAPVSLRRELLKHHFSF